MSEQSVSGAGVVAQNFAIAPSSLVRSVAPEPPPTQPSAERTKLECSRTSVISSADQTLPALIGVALGRGSGLERSNLIDLEDEKARRIEHLEARQIEAGLEEVLRLRRTGELSDAELVSIWERGR